jgi:hypothetical protein
MADYREITKHYPAMADFLRNQTMIRLRGDVLSYAANLSTPSFSTDLHGFRHTKLNGQNLSIVDCVNSERYGLVLGASNSFGFGVAGNENTMASILSERLGFPFGNCAMPGASSRNLHSLLISIIAGAPRPPSIVILSSGGDLATFCDASTADPIFGSPNRNQVAAEYDRGRAPPDPEPHFTDFLNFTALWAQVIARTCRRQGAALLMVHQSTFFEKSEPTAQEISFQLGVPLNLHHERMFSNHRRFNEGFFEKRKSVAEQLEIPLAGWGATGQLSFIDEFHLDRESTRFLSEKVATEIEKLASP